MELKKRKRRYLQIAFVLIRKRFPFTLSTYAIVADRLGLVAKTTRIRADDDRSICNPRHTKIPGRDAGTRMFAPQYGINEESATGMAAGPLACYLYDKMGINKEVYLIEQGHFMKPPSPSVITVKLNFEDGKITGLIAGGKAKVIKSLTISI
jgi:predicted PhzF superfamily epimerase YddE/YHI9